MARTVEIGTVVVAVVAAAAPLRADAVERWYSTRLYPLIQQVLTRITNLVPIALLDVLLVTASIVVVVAIARGVRQAWRTRRAAPLLSVLGHLAAAAAMVYLLFLGLWGLNYRRVPMSARLALSSQAPAREAVVRLGLQAIAGMNQLHDAAHEQGWPGDARQDTALQSAFASVQRELSDAPPSVPGRLKASMLSPYFRWTSVDGMINPFGLEVLANPDLLPFERAFVAAHEWSHLAGYADESEANFVGWLTCVRADVPAQYSGWLYLYWQVSGEVSSEDRARLNATLAEGPRRDVNAIVERIRRAQWPMLQAAGWAMYDKYLKANRVDEGIRSYGAVVTLILRARFEDGWMPVRRAAAPSP
jgi:uncharacterized protein DUF3810